MGKMVKPLFPKVFGLRSVLAMVLTLSIFCVSNILFTDEGKGLGPEGNDLENLISLHDKNSPNYSKYCTNSNCHADILVQESLDPEIPTAHVSMMINNTPGHNEKTRCAWCHSAVNLMQKSAGNLRRHVDVNLCAVCHGPSNEEMQYYQSEPTDGEELYGLVCSTCHGNLSNSDVRGEPVSEILEGIDENEGGMGPLDALTRQQISAIANALGRGRGRGGGGGGGDDWNDNNNDWNDNNNDNGRW